MKALAVRIINFGNRQGHWSSLGLAFAGFEGRALGARLQAGSATPGLPFIGSSFFEASAFFKSSPSALATPAP